MDGKRKLKGCSGRKEAGPGVAGPGGLLRILARTVAYYHWDNHFRWNEAWGELTDEERLHRVRVALPNWERKMHRRVVNQLTGTWSGVRAEVAFQRELKARSVSEQQ